MQNHQQLLNDIADLQQRLNACHVQLGALISALQTLPPNCRDHVIALLRAKQQTSHNALAAPLTRLVSALGVDQAASSSRRSNASGTAMP